MNPSLPPESPQASQPARSALLLPSPVTPVRRRWWQWVLVLAILAGGLYYFYFRAPAAGTAPGGASADGQPARRGPPDATRGNRPLAPVVAGTARTGDMNVYLNGLGAAVPLSTVTVRSRVDGQLMRILFTEGQMVKAGQLLAEIDPRAFQVQLTQAEGQMARDQALLVNARIDLERYQLLFKQDSIARQQLDTQQALVRQYEGAAKANQGAVDSAKLQLGYAKITAPVSGRLGLRLVDTGNFVRASDTAGLVVITQLQPITVLFTIPEDNIPSVMQKLAAGNKPPVDAYDRGQINKLASGTLLTVDNQIDPATGTVKLKAQFANTDFTLFPNQFVNTRMLIDVRRNAVIAPTAGVQRGSQGTFVYVVNADSNVALRLVKTGQVQGESTEILSGLAAGEVIVTDGVDKLRDGGKVEVARKDGVATKAGPRGSGSGKGNGTHSGRRGGDAAPATAGAPSTAETPAVPAAAVPGAPAAPAAKPAAVRSGA